MADVLLQPLTGLPKAIELLSQRSPCLPQPLVHGHVGLALLINLLLLYLRVLSPWGGVWGV